MKATSDGSVYVEISSGVYGLLQAGVVANELLEKWIAKHSYSQRKLVQGLWSHEWRPIQFTLVIDNFEVKYVGNKHAEHLIYVLQEDFTITCDWEVKLYVGITLYWDYKNNQIHLLVSGYIKATLQRFNHPVPTRRQDSSLPNTPPKYGAKI